MYDDLPYSYYFENAYFRIHRPFITKNRSNVYLTLFVGKHPYCYEENALSCLGPAWELISLRLRQDERLYEKLRSVKHFCFYIFSQHSQLNYTCLKTNDIQISVIIEIMLSIVNFVFKTMNFLNKRLKERFISNSNF